MEADRWQKIPPLSLASFFSFLLPIKRASSFSDLKVKQHALPSLRAFVGQEEFAKVLVAWNEEGLLFQIKVEVKLHERREEKELFSHRFELMIDTRDQKDISYPTKYCHHFLFYPGEVLPSEVTRFRGEESRKLADPRDLECSVEYSRTSYLMQVAISSRALYGFDPTQERRLGLCYQIHRPDAPSQTLLVDPTEYRLERVPSLWASCLME